MRIDLNVKLDSNGHDDKLEVQVNNEILFKADMGYEDAMLDVAIGMKKLIEMVSNVSVCERIHTFVYLENNGSYEEQK